MSINRDIFGNYLISEVVNGRLIHRTYMFYTKKESIARFKEEVKMLKGGK